MDPRGDAFAVADDREPPFAHEPDQRVIGGAVEAAVAERDPTGVRNRLVEVGHRRVRLLCSRWRVGVERVVFGLDHPTLAGVAVGGEALGDEAVHARLAPRS